MDDSRWRLLEDALMSTSRRDFLNYVGLAGGYGAAFAAMRGLGLLGAPAEAEPSFRLVRATPTSGKIVVLGAGIAGLVAAYELRKAGHDVQVLEARDRPGGRNWTVRAGTRVELTDGSVQTCGWAGGLYMNAGPGRIPSIHRRLLGYCRDFGIPLEVEINTSRSALVQADDFESGRPVAARRIVYDQRGAIAELLAKAAHRGALDALLTAEDRDRLLVFLRAYGDLGLDDRYVGTTRAGFVSEPGAAAIDGPLYRPISLHDLLASDFSRAEFYEDQINWQATMLQPVGGMDRIAHAFAERLGAAVTYGAAVREIRREGDGVRIVYGRSGATETFEAAHCICTLPATVLRRTSNDFSAAHRAALNVFRLTSSYKIGWQGPRFWETDDGIYGGISFLKQPVDLIWYPSAGIGQGEGVLLGGFGNETELDGTPTAFGRLGSTEAKLASSLRSIEKLHPGRSRLLGQPIFVPWNSIPYSLGAVADNKPEEAGVYRRMNTPDGPFVFAGDYLSHFAGWQEGALLSGLRAAALVSDRSQVAW